MKKMVEIYSKGNEDYYILDGKERGGFSTKEKAKADAKEMNRARKARGEKKFASGKAKNIRTGPIQQGPTTLTDAKRQRMRIKKWWDEIIKKLTKTCPVCGTENKKDAKRCKNCGADISDVK